MPATPAPIDLAAANETVLDGLERLLARRGMARDLGLRRGHGDIGWARFVPMVRIQSGDGPRAHGSSKTAPHRRRSRG
jgi:hypothetical protein